MERTLQLVHNPVDRVARVVEALLVIATKPLSVDELVTLTGDDAERVETALGLLASRYREGRSGIVLEQTAGGFGFRAAREAADACARLVERPVQRGLSQAALETLAVVAYKQPVTGPEITDIRGVNTVGVLGTLLERKLIKIAGRKQVVGRPFLYGTTREFLERFGLNDLSDLPKVEDMSDLLGFDLPASVTEPAPQTTLPFEPGTTPDDQERTHGKPEDKERVH
jgi:segregation and condensation protein B